jgi:large subunit ribosomal protein L17
MANMASSLILHKRIKTTTAKAKALRTYVEPLITKTKDLTTVEEKTHAQRVVFSWLQDKHAVKELFGDVASKVESRPGGYTRILKLGNRPGDNADMCIIELVDYNESMLSGKDTRKSTTRRSRRGGKKKSTADQVADSQQQTPVSDTPAADIENKSQTSDEQIVSSNEVQDAEVVETDVKNEESTTETSDQDTDVQKEDESPEANADEKEDTDNQKEGGEESKEDNPKK